MFSFVYNGIDFAHKFDAASAPNEKYFKHMHAYTEIVYLVKGDVSFTVGRERCKLKPRDLIIIPPGEYHFATVNTDVAYERYVFKFPNSVIPPFLVEQIKTSPHFFSPSKKFGVSFSMFDAYYKNYEKDTLLMLFIAEIVKTLIFVAKEATLIPDVIGNDVAKFLNYIDKHITENITLEKLCNEFHFSKSFISGEFKKYMNVPIIQYIKTKKIAAAHEMILGGEKKSVAAKLLGFENYSTFYRQYINYIKDPDNI